MCSLSDSALPTGGFVASSGLESFVQHGFISSSVSSPPPSGFDLLSFLHESMSSYAHLNLPFFEQSHAATWTFRSSAIQGSLQDTVNTILAVDGELEAMLLNHVTRRASKAQGIALLTLYSRAFATPSLSISAPEKLSEAETSAKGMDDLIEALKIASRRPARMQGHLSVCFAVLTAALGLSLGAMAAE